MIPTSLSLVVPMYDEAENVAPLLDRIFAAFEPLAIPWEVIAVDDGSGDDTLRRLREAQARHLRLRLESLPERQGQSAATVAGARAATGSHVATIDGDLQNDPADLPRMLDRLASADVVIGRRAVRRDRLARRLAGRIANGVRRAVLRDGASDTGCSLKVFPRDVFLALPAFDGMHRFLPALFRQQGLTIDEVAVGHRPRLKGRSKYGNLSRLGRGLVDLAGVTWLSRRTIRFRPDARSEGQAASPLVQRLR